MTTVPQTPVIDVTSVELEDSGPLAEALSDGMATRSKLLWAEGDTEAGVWSCTPGDSRWNLETHEFIYVAAGRMTVTRDGGEPVEIGAGDSAFFARGWQGTWLIHETILKSYVVF